MVVGLLATATPGCKGKPSKAECEGLFEHMLQLQTSGLSKRQTETARAMVQALKPNMVKECVEGMTRDTLACLMAAKDSKAAKECETAAQKGSS